MARAIASKLTTPACPQAREQGHDQQASRAMCNALDPYWLSPIPLSLGGVRTHGSDIASSRHPLGMSSHKGRWETLPPSISNAIAMLTPVRDYPGPNLVGGLGFIGPGPTPDL